MDQNLTQAIVRASRIVGLGLLTVAFFSFNGGRTEKDFFMLVGLALGIWCLVEILRAKSQPPV